MRREGIRHTDFPDIAVIAAKRICCVPALSETAIPRFISVVIFQMIIRRPEVKFITGMIRQFQELHIINGIRSVPIRVAGLPADADRSLELIAKGQDSARNPVSKDKPAI